jgi:hypothetical protein
MAQVEALRALLGPSGWLDRTRHFADALRVRSRTAHGLLIVGTPTDEPWHLTAHLTEESQLADLPGLMPTLVRWTPPPGARPHLSVGIERLGQVNRSETLLVVSQDLAPERLLDRVADARKAGAAIFALDQGDPELDGLVHESLAVRQNEAPISFDAAQHLVSFAVGETELGSARGSLGEVAAWELTGGRGGLGRAPGRGGSRPGGLPGGSVPGPGGSVPAGLRGKLNRLLNTISGPQSD